MNLKKEKELQILRTVFKKKRFPKYTPREQPDFVLHAKQDFGVEITEYYTDETVARLHNFNDYVEKVTEGTYIHKDDKNVLDVVTTEIFNEKKQKWVKIDTPAVRQENKSIYFKIATLLNIVAEKSDLYHTYDNGISNIDLIIYDARGSLLDGMNDAYMRRLVKEDKIRAHFIKSEFRNIYLIIPGFSIRPVEVIQLK